MSAPRRTASCPSAACASCTASASGFVKIGEALPFTQSGTRVQITNVPATDETGLWPALRIECDGPPVVYQTGGLRIPKAPHPHYDSCPSDLAH